MRTVYVRINDSVLDGLTRYANKRDGETLVRQIKIEKVSNPNLFTTVFDVNSDNYDKLMKILKDELNYEVHTLNKAPKLVDLEEVYENQIKAITS